MKHLMSGNEATARGVYEAGIKICSAYPGTPSTEILENLPPYQKDVYCEWAPNEKVAVEVAYGASIAGSRSFWHHENGGPERSGGSLVHRRLYGRRRRLRGGDGGRSQLSLLPE